MMQTSLLTDYGKLSAVGTAIGSDPSWDWEPETTTQAIAALQATTTASAYSALVPVPWEGGYNLTPDFDTQHSSDNVGTLICYPPENNHPFAGEPPQNQFHALTSIAGDGSTVDQAWVLAHLNLSQWVAGSGANRTAQMPPATLTDYIYGPYATGHTQSNIEYYGAYQYAPQWWRDTYNPPSHTVCGSTSGNKAFLSLAFGPPNITAPPP